MSKLSGGFEGALLLAPECPSPVAGGGAMRTASLAAFLKERFELHVVSFTTAAEAPPPLPSAARTDWVRLPAHSKALPARLARNTGRWLRGTPPLTDRFCTASSRAQVEQALAGRRYRLAVVEHSWCASYVPLAREHAAFTVLDLHNVESILHARCANSEPAPARWAHRRFAAAAEREEREWLPRFDLILAASEHDRERVLERAPRANVAVYPNAIPGRFPAPAEEEHCIAFSGNLEYHPNATAVRFFARQVWPELRRDDPALRWRLIGKNENAVRRWIEAGSGIEATGPVADALAELARAKVVVAPLLAGSGTRVKILEAWAAGRAVVSTRLGAEGLPAVDGEHLLLADSPAAIRAAVRRLLEDGALRRRLGEAGRSLVERELCWPVAWRCLEQHLAAVLPKVSPAVGVTCG